MKYIKYLLLLLLVGWYVPVHVIPSAEITTLDTGAAATDIEGLHVSVNDNGHAMAVWGINDSGGTSGRQIMAAYFDGSSWGSATEISSGSTNYAPWVSLNNEGKAVAVWQSDLTSGHVVVNSYVSSSWGSATNVTTSSVLFEDDSVIGLTQSKPTSRVRVGVDNSGNAVVTWIEVDNSTAPTEYFVYASRSLGSGASTSWSTPELLNTGLTSAGTDQEHRIFMDPRGEIFDVYGRGNNTGLALISWLRASDGAYLSRYLFDGSGATIRDKYAVLVPGFNEVGTSNGSEINANGDYLVGVVNNTQKLTRFLELHDADNQRCEHIGGSNNNFYSVAMSLSNLTPPTLHQAAAFRQIGASTPFSNGAGYSILVSPQRLSITTELDCGDTVPYLSNTEVIDYNADYPRLNPQLCTFTNNNAVLAWNSQGATNADSKIGLMFYDASSNAWSTQSIQYIDAKLTTPTSEQTNVLDMPFYLSCSRLVEGCEHNTALIWWDSDAFEVKVLMSRKTGRPVLPSPVSNLKVDGRHPNFAQPDREIRISWNVSSDSNIATQKVFESISGGSFTEIASLGPTETFFDDQDLNDNVEYTYFVRVTNDDGLFSDSNIVSINTRSADNKSFTPYAVDAQCVENNGQPVIDITWDVGFGTNTRIIFDIYRSSIVENRLIASVEYSNGTFGEDFSYQDTDVEAGTKYLYYIVLRRTGLSRREVSDPSCVASVTACVGAPPAPQRLNATCVDPTTVDLLWEAPSTSAAIDAQRIYRSSAADGRILVMTVGSSAESFTGDTVTTGVAYEYEVVAVKNNIESNPVRTTVTCNATMPDPPTNVQATCQVINGVVSGITVTWSPTPGITNYRVYRDGHPDVIATVNTDEDGVGYRDENVASGIPYYYGISAVDTLDNESEKVTSNPVSCFDTPKPDTIVDLSIPDCEVGSFIELAWTPPTENCTKLEIYRTDGLDQVLVVTIEDDACFTTDGYTDHFTVASGTLYNYFIREYNGDDVFVDSNDIDIACTAGDPEEPEEPECICEFNSDNKPVIRLSWELSPTVGVTGYRVYRNNFLIATLGALETSYSDEHIFSGFIYSYNIAAVNASGEKRTGTCKCSCIPAPNPSNLQGSCTFNQFALVGEYSKILTWTIADNQTIDGQPVRLTNVASQEIYRDGVLIATVSASVRQFEDHDRPVGVSETYEVRVRATSGIQNQTRPTVTVIC